MEKDVPILIVAGKAGGQVTVIRSSARYNLVKNLSTPKHLEVEKKKADFDDGSPRNAQFDEVGDAS